MSDYATGMPVPESARVILGSPHTVWVWLLIVGPWIALELASAMGRTLSAINNGIY